MIYRPGDFQEGVFPVPPPPPPPIDPPRYGEQAPCWPISYEPVAEEPEPEPEPRRPVYNSDDVDTKGGSSMPSYFSPSSYPSDCSSPVTPSDPSTFCDRLATVAVILLGTCLVCLALWITGFWSQDQNGTSAPADFSDSRPESPEEAANRRKMRRDRELIRLSAETQFVQKVMKQQDLAVLVEWLKEAPELRPLSEKIVTWGWLKSLTLAGPLPEFDRSHPEPKFTGWRMSPKAEMIVLSPRAFLLFCVELGIQIPDPQSWDPPRELVIQWLFLRQFVHAASAHYNFDLISNEVVHEERDRLMKKANLYDEKSRRFRDLPVLPDRDNPPKFPRVVESLLGG